MSHCIIIFSTMLKNNVLQLHCSRKKNVLQLNKFCEKKNYTYIYRHMVKK